MVDADSSGEIVLEEMRELLSQTKHNTYIQTYIHSFTYIDIDIDLEEYTLHTVNSGFCSTVLNHPSAIL